MSSIVVFASTAQGDLVLQHLIENASSLRWSFRQERRRPSSAKPKKQFIWPDKKRRRSYEIVIFPCG